MLLLDPITAACAGEIHRGETTASELKELSLEELMNIDGTSVARKEEKLFEAASATDLSTSENIRLVQPWYDILPLGACVQLLRVKSQDISQHGDTPYSASQRRAHPGGLLLLVEPRKIFIDDHSTLMYII